MRTALVVWALALAQPASGGPVRFIVSIGNDFGFPDEPTLRYASRDARRVAEVLAGLGDVPPRRVYVLDNEREPEVRRVLGEVTREARRHDPADVELLVYFSGHGDEDSLHLSANEVSLERFQEYIRLVPARTRIVLVDACRSAPVHDYAGLGAAGPRDVARGGRRAAFAVAARGKPGLVLVRSASAGEQSQESDELGGGVFTHYLVNGLRGAADLNDDRRVTLKEVYTYAHARTLQRSVERGAVQRSTATASLARRAHLALTRPSESEATVVLPARAQTRYRVFALPRGTMVAEAWTTADRSVRLALPVAGRYVVQRENRSGYAAAQIALPWGGSAELDHDDFEPRHALSLSSLSRARALENHELAIGYGAATTGTAFGHGAQLRYGYRFDTVALTIGLDLAIGALDLGDGDGQTQRVGADVRLEWRGRFDPLELRIGAGGQVAGIREGPLDRPGTLELAWGPVVATELHVPLSGRWLWRISAVAAALFSDDGSGQVVQPTALLTTGPAFEF